MTLLIAVMVLTTPGEAATPTLTTIYTFGAGMNDGTGPLALVRGNKGVLYGETYQGGSVNTLDGTVFRLTPPSAGQTKWTEKILHSFGASGDGCNPQGGLVLDSAGNLYGTTFFGGAYNGGIVFELSPPAINGGNWTETILYTFGQASDPDLLHPYTLVGGSAGKLFGTTVSGAVFELSGNPLKLSVIYQFQGGVDGSASVGISADASGNIYGTTEDGGIYYDEYNGYLGTVFELSPPIQPGGSWTKATLFSFPDPTAGYHPLAAVIVGPGGNLYGTTYDDVHGNYGLVFELTPPALAGQPWVESILHSFYGPDGGFILSPVAFDSSGNLFGITGNGGLYNSGTVFKLKPPTMPGGVWTPGWSIAFYGTFQTCMPPVGNLVVLSDSTIYGTTNQCGYSLGTVYQIQP